jgi:hypothetical protein
LEIMDTAMAKGTDSQLSDFPDDDARWLEPFQKWPTPEPKPESQCSRK